MYQHHGSHMVIHSQIWMIVAICQCTYEILWKKYRQECPGNRMTHHPKHNLFSLATGKRTLRGWRTHRPCNSWTHTRTPYIPHVCVCVGPMVWSISNVVHHMLYMWYIKCDILYGLYHLSYITYWILYVLHWIYIITIYDAVDYH